MTPVELAALLSKPTSPLLREAIRSLPLDQVEALVIEGLAAAEDALRQIVVDRVAAFVAEQEGDGPAPMTAYFTPTERRATEGLTWSPFVAALASTEEIPDLRHTSTQVVCVPVEEAELADAMFADPQLSRALTRLASMDEPGHEDVLRVHLPTREVTRVRL
ncbi:hypothetical protein OHB41_50095 [Streptomyces sp. NBC_01571]|uniref:hypothetical protein n=1 Tax=Streptomyces sp. NBC_01571 TaxID=2975883 RepID=UPI0022573004|nr:hypothetical protein [Streptomyces sp. NBC_01571]MCX4581117.1 hypothetical protein [Streptomyces sp. NBC_01571]